MPDILKRLRVDAGQLTLGALIEDRALAAAAIEYLRSRVDRRALGKSFATTDVRERTVVPQQPATTPALNALLRLSDVSRLFGVSRSTIYKRMAAGDFPKPLRISERSVRWRMADLQEWASTLANAEYR